MLRLNPYNFTPVNNGQGENSQPTAVLKRPHPEQHHNSPNKYFAMASVVQPAPILQQMQTQIEEGKAKNLELSQRLTQMEQSYRGQFQKLEQMLEKTAEDNNQLSKKLAATQAERDQVQQQLSEMKEANNAHEAKTANLELLYNGVNFQSDLVRRELGQVKQLISPSEIIEKIKSELQGIHIHLQQSHQFLTSFKNTSNNNANGLAGRLDKIQQQRLLDTSEISDLGQKVEKLRHRSHRLRSKVKTLKKDNTLEYTNIMTAAIVQALGLDPQKILSSKTSSSSSSNQVATKDEEEKPDQAPSMSLPSSSNLVSSKDLGLFEMYDNDSNGLASSTHLSSLPPPFPSWSQGGGR